MKCSSVICVLAVVAMVQTFMVVPGESLKLSCGQVNSLMSGCIPFLTGSTTTPSDVCCSGARNLEGLTQSVSDKRAACECLKTAANSMPNLKDQAAASLPTQCGIVMNIPISRNINCNSISRAQGNGN
ncbi:non-specific lipid-transfer protein B [Manihot esculenta]|uniref:Non-specific lipid-transfer protein n=1 Tax=Manihot esculenta TaxID=3983 RepID=A0A2C9WF97_MANES|nr:non-specific lipid-transfer protein B [Manihot esculenta]OAY58550.1 hypothetical protein MANES_02G187100v8 [Manihot esculenta]